jgi:hypothetical protein
MYFHIYFTTYKGGIKPQCRLRGITPMEQRLGWVLCLFVLRAHPSWQENKFHEYINTYFLPFVHFRF